jgi:hypothetical protein
MGRLIRVLRAAERDFEGNFIFPDPRTKISKKIVPMSQPALLTLTQ